MLLIEPWLVPHFEKMLYDNALLVDVLASAYQATQNEDYRRVIEETLAFIKREMSAPGGGFYSALDADSEGVEGKFYVWDKSEIEEVLGGEAAIFCAFYGISKEGNWEGHNILWRPHDEEEFSKEWEIPATDLRNRLKSARQLLFEKRNHRIRPGLDDKIILSWNALQVKAYARAARVLDNPSFKSEAIQNINFLWNHFLKEDYSGFFHVYKDGRRQYDAFLDDYAFLIEALIAVYELTFETEYLRKANQVCEWAIAQFLDEKDKLFYFTSEKQDDLLLRRKDFYDSATPSGNSVMSVNLLKLGILFNRPDWRQLAEQLLAKMSESVQKYPSSFANWAKSLMNHVFPTLEIAVLGKDVNTIIEQFNQAYLPNKVLMASTEENSEFSLLAGKSVLIDTKIYLCQNYSCQLPVSSIDELLKEIEGLR